jgi:hypothetical protein
MPFSSSAGPGRLAKTSGLQPTGAIRWHTGAGKLANDPFCLQAGPGMQEKIAF